MPLNFLGSSCSSGGGKRRKGRKGRMSGKKRRSRGRSFKLSRGKRITRKGRRRRRTRRGGASPPATEFLTKENLRKLITDAKPYFGVNDKNEMEADADNKRKFLENKKIFLDNIDRIFMDFQDLSSPASPINLVTGGGTYGIWIQYDILDENKYRQQFDILNVKGAILTNNKQVESKS